MTTSNERERLLGILHAHGQQFLSAFDTPDTPKREVEGLDISESEEEWTGFGSPLDRDAPDSTVSDSEYDDLEQRNGSVDSAAGALRTPGVVVFQESTREQPTASLSANRLRRSFMSSKVCNITLPTQPISKGKIHDGESDDERTNTQNDVLLHHLVHTKLLSGSLDPELHLDHAQRGKALAGRVLELTGEAKLGKGESVFRQEQRNKAAKRVRDGLTRKQRMREQKVLEEAKNLGNYHPTLKRLYDVNSLSTPKRKRSRGLGMGVGKFVGGSLKLSREEIASVTGSGQRLWASRRRGGNRQPH